MIVFGSGSIGSVPPASEGTLAPPGTPEFWFDGSDIDGSSNSSLTANAEFSTWTNKGSYVGVNLSTLPFFSPPKYYVGANFKGARFDYTGGGFSGKRGLGTGVVEDGIDSWLAPAPRHTYTMACIVKISSADLHAHGNQSPLGSYVNGSSNAPLIVTLRSDQGYYIGGATWQGSVLDNVGGGVGIPFTSPGGQRQDIVPDMFTVLTFTVNGASSSFGTDHQTKATDTVTPLARRFDGLVVGGPNEGSNSLPMVGEIAQVLMYYNTAAGTSPTHEQIVAWAESVYGGTAPFAPGFEPTVNQVARIVKSGSAESHAGAYWTLGAAPGVSPAFTATRTTMTMRVYSPTVGVPIRLKIEDGSNSANIHVETEAITTVANAWETLTFNFDDPVAGTLALNLAYVGSGNGYYNRGVVFPNFGTTGAQGGGGTYYFDDLILLGDGDNANTTLATFDTPPGSLYTDFNGSGFGGATAEVVDDPDA